MRLDKWLAGSGMGSRKDVKGMIRKGRVKVNEDIEKDPGRQLTSGVDQVWLDEVPVTYVALVYYMLHKPQGVISATEDSTHRTVMDLIGAKDQRDGLYPVGRLDKDTEGLLLITNDGPLGHQLLSPRHHVDKTYEAVIDGPVTNGMIQQFEEGIELNGDGRTRPAYLSIQEQRKDETRVQIVITEGKFHQIKRMFHAVGREVLYLKRTEMGPLKLDPTLSIGDYRALTEEEIEALKEP